MRLLPLLAVSVCALSFGCSPGTSPPGTDSGTTDAGPPRGGCADGVQNGSETDIDCGGGLCTGCAPGGGCVVPTDCEDGLCGVRLRCLEPTCMDRTHNGAETDVDCGGPDCGPCANERACRADADCASMRCQGGVCASPVCNDGAITGEETDVDCGGSMCPACEGGQMCADGGDCSSTVCDMGVCTTPACDDLLQNGDESDVDCGGGTCPDCADGAVCRGPTDCASGVCTASTCIAPACDDGVHNGDELDVDCGGSCPDRCPPGAMCSDPAECASGVCTDGACVAPACDDMVMNGGETGVDCGGTTGCPRCPDGSSCGGDSDCATSPCMSGICGAARCHSGAARVLVYGPGGSTGTAWFPAGTVTTIASDAMWRGMTTADFGQYDVLYMAGGNCAGTPDTVHGTAQDTATTWGPAIRGRVLIAVDDADLHGGSQAMTFHRNLIDWLKTAGRNADGGRTSVYMSWGCTMASSYTPGARGTPEQFTSVFGSPLTGDGTNYCTSVAATPAAAGHGVMTGLPPFWGCPFHGGFGTIPAGYTPLVIGTSSPANPVLAARESPMPCIP